MLISIHFLVAFFIMYNQLIAVGWHIWFVSKMFMRKSRAIILIVQYINNFWCKKDMNVQCSTYLTNHSVERFIYYDQETKLSVVVVAWICKHQSIYFRWYSYYVIISCIWYYFFVHHPSSQQFNANKTLNVY